MTCDGICAVCQQKRSCDGHYKAATKEQIIYRLNKNIYPELRKYMVDYLKRRYGVDYDPRECGPGCDTVKETDEKQKSGAEWLSALLLGAVFGAASSNKSDKTEDKDSMDWEKEFADKVSKLSKGASVNSTDEKIKPQCAKSSEFCRVCKHGVPYVDFPFGLRYACDLDVSCENFKRI
ncbi:MAG: hypothetical protein NC299_11910 [Lachnospiraceae bacterium]|nr:hypothetical protein [Lachnospiraceae bacterium]